MDATEVETAMVLKVSQIVEGDVKCATCGKGAVLVVNTEPDGEPGEACFEHAWDWITMSMGLVRNLFGPKAA